MGHSDIGGSTNNPPVQQGATFTLNFTAYTSTALTTAYDFTGYTLAAKARRHYDSTAAAVSFTATILSATAGTGRLALTSTQTAALTEGYYVYDVEATNSTGASVLRILEGRMLVTPQVTY